MDFQLFLISFIIILISYLMQLIKVIKIGNTNGLSLDAYYLTIISLFIITISSNDKFVIILTAIELVLSLLSIIIIIYYQKIWKPAKEFFLAVFFSFLMIFGVAQSIKSFKSKGYSSVSITSHLLWFFLNSILIYLSNDIYIQIPLMITNILYIYIILDTFRKNML